MTLTVKGKHFDLKNGIRAEVEEKVSKLTKYFDHIIDVDVEFSHEKGKTGMPLLVEITLHASGRLIRSEVEEKEPIAALDKAIEKLERQLKKYKGRLRERRFKRNEIKEAALLLPSLVAEGNDDGDVAAGSGATPVVRTKRFPLKPMDIEEAVMQSELLGHHFFVFLNEDSENINVLYKRKDGSFGLIVPEVS